MRYAQRSKIIHRYNWSSSNYNTETKNFEEKMKKNFEKI